MHERTERALAQLAFVGLCALPTCMTLASVVYRSTSWHRRGVTAAVAEDWSLRTGWDVAIDDARVPSPGVKHLRRIDVAHPETSRPIATVRAAEVRVDDDAMAVSMHGVDVHPPELTAAWDILDRRVMRRPRHVPPRLHLVADDLTIGRAWTLRDVDAWIESTGDGVRATVTALPADAADGDAPIMITAARDSASGANDGSPTTSWTFSTGNTAVPAAALADHFPALLRRLGPDATLRGGVRWTDAAAPAIDLTGLRIDDVSLDRLLTDTPHRVTGNASLVWTRGLLRPGRRIDWVLDVTATDGLLPPDTLAALAGHLGWRTLTSDGPLPFDRLAFRVELNDDLLTLTGLCGEHPDHRDLGPGVAAASGRQPVALTSSGPKPATVLTALLCPDVPPSVPFTSSNRWLLSALLPPRPARRSATDPTTRSAEPTRSDELTRSAEPTRSDGPPRPRIRSARDYRGGPAVSQPF